MDVFPHTTCCHAAAAGLRSDCPQVVIALVVTPEGFPLAYEILPGNTADEYEIVKMDDVSLLPLSQINERFTELDPTQ